MEKAVALNSAQLFCILGYPTNQNVAAIGK